MPVRRRNRRSIDPSQPRGSRPKFLLLKDNGGSGPANSFLVEWAPENYFQIPNRPYLGTLSIKGPNNVYPNNNLSTIVSVSSDNSGPGGQAVLYLLFDAQLDNKQVIFPANNEQIRGQNGEWISAQELTATV